MYSKQELGAIGESIARAYYRKRGFVVLEENFRCRYGEIDLLCRKGDSLYAIEVKTRSSNTYGHPEEAVSTEKQHRIKVCTEEYVRISGRKHSGYIFNVVSVLWENSRYVLSIYTFE